jgi:hypothetical protein
MPTLYTHNFETEFNNAKDPSYWDIFFEDLGTSWDYYTDMITPDWFKRPWTQEEVDNYNNMLSAFLVGYYAALFYVWIILL